MGVGGLKGREGTPPKNVRDGEMAEFLGLSDDRSEMLEARPQARLSDSPPTPAPQTHSSPVEARNQKPLTDFTQGRLFVLFLTLRTILTMKLNRNSRRVMSMNQCPQPLVSSGLGSAMARLNIYGSTNGPLAVLISSFNKF